MALSNLSVTLGETFSLSKVNSGLPSTTAGPGKVTMSTSVTSGQFFTQQLAIASGQTQLYDLASGTLTDLVGVTVNMKTVYGLTVAPASGAILYQTSVSGTPNNWFLTSGSAILVPPGGGFSYQEPIQSGAGFTFAAATGSMAFKAVSGGSLLTFGVNGI